MGKRLSRIVTRTGDDGTTSLGDGSRVTKDSLRVDALGDIDELNSHVGTIIAFNLLARCVKFLFVFSITYLILVPNCASQDRTKSPKRI